MPVTEPTPAGSKAHPLELRIPPLLLALLIGLAMWVLGWSSPGFAIGLPASAWIAAALCLAGAGVVLAAVLAFRRAQTTLNPIHPESSSSLVSTGIYRFSRNPMYLGFALALLGYVFWLSNPLALLGPLGFVLWMNRFQIRPEERALGERFGEAFRRYCGAVRRWV